VKDIFEIPVTFKHAESSLGKKHMNARIVGNSFPVLIPFEVTKVFAPERKPL
jgi:hypothetical protein